MKFLWFSINSLVVTVGPSVWESEVGSGWLDAHSSEIGESIWTAWSAKGSTSLSVSFLTDWNVNSGRSSDAASPPLVLLAFFFLLEGVDSVRVFLHTVESLVVELPFIWTLLDTLGSSPGLGSFWALLVDKGWSDLLTSVLTVVVFTSLEGWLQVELTSEDISLGSALELTEPEHHLVDVGGEGQIRWINEGWWGDSLNQDTLWSLSEHLENKSVLTVHLNTNSVGFVVDESWFTGLLLTLLGLRIVGEGLILTFSLLANLSLLVVNVSLVFTFHPFTLVCLFVQNVVWWASTLDALLSVPLVVRWALESSALVGSLNSDSEWWA